AGSFEATHVRLGRQRARLAVFVVLGRGAGPNAHPGLAAARVSPPIAHGSRATARLSCRDAAAVPSSTPLAPPGTFCRSYWADAPSARLRWTGTSACTLTNPRRLRRRAPS